MLVILRFAVTDPAEARSADGDASSPGDAVGGPGEAVGGPAEAEFRAAAQVALQTLAARPGYLSGQLARAYDDPTRWTLATEWESVGAYRRALGAYEVKVHATPLLARALDEPTAYEPLARAAPGGPVTVTASDLRPLRSRP